MSPVYISCSNTTCDGRAEKLGGLCPKCEAEAKKQRAGEWRWKGWTRADEREQLKGKRKGQK